MDNINDGRSVKYGKDCIIVLRQILQYAEDTYDMVLPTRFKVKYPSRNMVEDDENRVRTYSMDDIVKIISFCKENPSPKTLGLMIAFYTGCRIGELCGLKWVDVDLENKTIWIRRTVERINLINEKNSRIAIQTPKTIHSKRVIPINKALIEPLKNWKRITKDDFFVLSMTATPVEPRVYRNFYRDLVLNKCKLAYCLKFHAIRHTFASQLITNGADIKTVSEILGHSTPSITLGIYTHTNDNIKKKCANMLKYS